MKLTEAEATYVVQALRELVGKMPGLTETTMINATRLVVIEEIYDVFQSNGADGYRLEDILNLSGQDAQHLVNCTVEFLRSEARGTVLEDLRTAGFDITS